MRTRTFLLLAALLLVAPATRLCAQVPLAASMPLIASAGASSPDVQPVVTNSLPSGSYAFLLQGSIGGASAGAIGSGMAVVGSLTLDGQGNVSGEEDVVGGATFLANDFPITGTYAFNANGIGILSITDIYSRINHQYAVFLPSPVVPTTPASATLIETDGVATAKGILLMQQPSNLLVVDGTYALDLRGETACTNCSQYGHDGGVVLASGQVTFTPTSGSGTFAANVSQTLGTTVAPNASLSGMFTAPDGAGRFNMYAPDSESFGDDTISYVGYIVDSSTILLMSGNGHNESVLLSGSALGEAGPL